LKAPANPKAAAVNSKLMKKPAAASEKSKQTKKQEVEEESDEEVEESEVESEAEEVEPEEESDDEESEAEEASKAEEDEDMGVQLVAVAKQEDQSEKDVIAERTKELKSMPAGDLKELVEGHGLEKGTKEAMIKSMLKYEAKVRTAAKEQKAKIRAVVVKKKQELESLSILELGKLCNDMGLKGLKSKPERVQRLLIQWQENDGVDQALTKIAQEERKTELNAMDITKLQKFCNKLGVDPFVKEVMVERISKEENQKGCYARPIIKQMAEEAPKEKKGDMIDELLANEKERKKEKVLRDQQEEALAKKRKELKAMPVDELKKRLSKKGLESTGKRDDMVDALFFAGVQEDAIATRKTELQAKSQQDLKELLSLNSLETGSKEQMVKAMLAHEAKSREELAAFEAKVDQAAAQKQKQLESKSNATLKELCVAKGLPVKGEKNERIERLIEEAKKDREFDKSVSTSSRNKRTEELMSQDKTMVLKLCEATGVDPFVKDIMIERVMAYESEAGDAIAAGDSDQPAPKKARR